MRLKAIPEAEMGSTYPKAWRYLSRFESELRHSGIFRRYFKSSNPFYSIFNIGDYTFCHYKVLTREIAGSLTSAVVGRRDGKPCIPDHKLIMVGCDGLMEANFLCAALNSSPARLFVDSYVIKTQFSTHIFDLLAIPPYSEGNKTHTRLAELSEAAHKAAAKGNSAEVKRIEEEIDGWAAKLWNLSDKELAEMKRALEEM